MKQTGANTENRKHIKYREVNVVVWNILANNNWVFVAHLHAADPVGKKWHSGQDVVIVKSIKNKICVCFQENLHLKWQKNRRITATYTINAFM